MDNEKVIIEALRERSKPKAKKAKAKSKRIKQEKLSTIQNRLYKKWSEIVHALSGNRCEVCGATGKLDAHHVQPRQICSGLRFDPRNGVCLCPSHHKWGHNSAHKGMLWFVDWFQKNRSQDYNYLIPRLDSLLNCNSRQDLYEVEFKLHNDYDRILGKLPYFDVVYNVAEHQVIQAYNVAAASSYFYRHNSSSFKIVSVTPIER